LAHLRNRYTLRSHQVAAGDYFRKEATHRAAVAARNLNRHLLIKKADRSLYEPSGIIMPEYEITRLRVVQAPKRFPVRLWKREYRGPADWIEVEDRTPMGGPVIFKRDSHLRKELVLRVKRTPVPKFAAAIRYPVDRKVPVAVADEVQNTQVVHIFENSSTLKLTCACRSCPKLFHTMRSNPPKGTKKSPPNLPRPKWPTYFTS